MKRKIDCTEHELIWLAGILEGEGSFLKPTPSRPNTLTIKIQMTDKDVVKRVADIFGGYAVNIIKPKELHHKQSYSTFVRGIRAVEWMNKLHPYMFERRRKQIEDALACYDPSVDATGAKNKKLKAIDLPLIKKALRDKSIRQTAKLFNVSHETMRRFLKE